ncbi:MAG: histidine phosphatase family protein [Chitinophagaceae bacterium]|nr:MAG: histidine phosphatase family protein [Chitinophagaceae bacterium]
MRCLLFLSFLLLLASCTTQRYYIVRHAEKAATAPGTAMTSSDPPLTDAGKKRAEDLKEVLKTKKIGYIFSTNTVRTRETAEPTRAYFGLTTETYAPMPDEAFISRLKALNKNALIVGHSNTVDDIVNKLSGNNYLTDLPETEYNHLLVVIKKGRKWKFESLYYGQ